MSWRIIDITQDGRYLHAEREWLVIREEQTEIGRVPLPDIQSVLVHAGHATYSHGLLLKLSAHDIPLVICNHRHEPVSILAPLSSHHLHAGRARAQAESPLPVRKRMWRELIRAKIAEQARTLAPFDSTGEEGLKKMIRQVRSGDPDNTEARAARYYWRRLFGKDFQRDRTRPGLNGHLNYGYTILRSALARAVAASGLVPSLGVGHINMRNNFALVDDLIEPFRPLVDRLVYAHRHTWEGDVSPEAKTLLAGMMERTVRAQDGETDLFRIMALLVNSLVHQFEGQDTKLELPEKLEFISNPSLPGLDGYG
ncbi:type II CRISPR-associated endonuclease Cas1 [Varunaivibrio sulfuroxidans]|uniref:CRISPR-associated endonuclease Cas1 n=1 Tax=Varunaivibrio sulfuroxidans TaxID=1773489 RepID=A0A4R3JAF9_9PROT|nr:type II CRISPR-associated endonuclease Cas1 [Varunaivibrio sulfuroxidans]TCS61620.1 CRISPR-associated Cas1 family protein [Varunaivibrio sulfuroxidans]WES29505.1 type II CRISPR-associated endonuclease Cas1 [Varunaivibrio sulfuroxidans]